ncbi:hypothetical protein FHP29_13010 [Nocardioides albidus]|uniref:Uncharacterized protein n=1 Tax=Nocardioides albidus TaxID=1517589 RepID=A0A5C4VV49_9ACTN|nr:hypothetical protein [Nocardioides albidus]TNM39772.1 hypothetical protein FHP29_13010 [Nocardioides albidus]
MVWPRDPEQPFTLPRLTPPDLPPEVKALVARAQEQARRATKMRIPQSEAGPGQGRDPLEALARRTTDPEYHALLAQLRAGELTRGEVMRHPAYLRNARQAMRDLLAETARLADGGASLRAQGRAAWEEFRADPDGDEYDEEPAHRT